MSGVRMAVGAVAAATAMGLGTAFAHLDEGVGFAGHYESALTGEGVSTEGAAATSNALLQQANAPYDGLYHFMRIRYEVGGRGFRGRRGGREPMWAHDYPRAERNFMAIMEETTFVRSQTQGSNIVALSDPELFKYPIAYIVEVGSWNPNDEDVRLLGEYLQKGGFLIVDDTRGERGTEWNNFAFHMERALPDHTLFQVDYEHEIFDSFFRIDPLAVIPPYGPRDVQYYAMFEDNDPTKRMMVIFNFNNDLSEYWEYSDQGYYPIDLANEAYKLGVNYVVYGLTH